MRGDMRAYLPANGSHEVPGPDESQQVVISLRPGGEPPETREARDTRLGQISITKYDLAYGTYWKKLFDQHKNKEKINLHSFDENINIKYSNISHISIDLFLYC